MNVRFGKELPGFLMYHPFFEQLSGAFEPLTLAEDEKREYVKALQMLHGTAEHEFRQLRDDLDLTAQVLEARRYAGSRVYVRFSFQRLTEDGTFGRPFQLMVVFDVRRRILAYMVLRDRGEMEDGIRYRMVRTRSSWDDYTPTRDRDEARAFLRNEPMGAVELEGVAGTRGFLLIMPGKGRYGDEFEIQWRICCHPWFFILKDVDAACVEHVLDELERGGMTALEDAADWRPLDFIEEYRRQGVPFQIMWELYRFLERAKRDGDTMVEETIRAVGIVGVPPYKPGRRIHVRYGSKSEMQMELFNESKMGDKVDASDCEKARILTYLALRGHVWSIHGLGWCFHFGRGVPVDYRKAIYWQEKSAAMGDVLSMQNLGVIYTEKNSPVHDCAKGMAWFEKAVAGGDTLAMGQLARCLLCKKPKDPARALELSKKACEANPGDEEFRGVYERALKASRGEDV